MTGTDESGRGDKQPVKNRDWIAELLERVAPVVEWDRFTVGEINDSQIVDIYGWIDRDDDYKDFVWTRFWPETENMEFTTSSDEYSEWLQVEWFGEDSLDEHNECRRVEHAFDIENAVTLTEDASIEEFATDGGQPAEDGRAIAQNASVDDSLTFGEADPTITSLEDVHLDSTLVLVGCGAAKRDPEDPTDRHLATVPEGEDVPGYGTGPAWPAEDLYTSTYFAVKREFAEVVTAWANSRDATPWAVLSAEHGILPHWQDVPRYDTTIDDLGDDPENPDHHVDFSIVRRRPDGREIVTEMDLWATNVAYGLARWLSGYRERGDAALTSRVNSLLVLAGQDYIEPLRERGVFRYGISRMAGNPNEQLASLDPDVRFLFEEIDAEGIGEQMGWLSDTVDTLEPLVNDVEDTEQDTLVTDGGQPADHTDGGNQTRVLNLYAGIGGNRANWENVDVTAVEIDEEIAAEYQRQFPEDTVVVADAHEFLKDHYNDGWDFIWASPPCQTHSKLSFASWHSDQAHNADREAEYPDMKLYQEVILLENLFDGDWAVENVNPYYDELRPAQKVGRHLIWSNYHIPEFEEPDGDFDFTSGKPSDREALEEWLGINLTTTIYIGDSHDPAQVLRNAVHPEVGKHVFEARETHEQATLGGEAIAE